MQNPASPEPPDMPSRITIDGVPYVVCRAAMNDEDGEFCAASQQIKVQAGVPDDYARVTLLHELIHACFEHAGSPEVLTEELVACMVSRRLLPILRDNPHLVAYLTADDRRTG